jgi:hypothetical protein
MRTDRQTDGRTDRKTDMTEVIVAFRNFANAAKNEWNENGRKLNLKTVTFVQFFIAFLGGRYV